LLIEGRRGSVTERDPEQQEDKYLADFLLKDYEIKVRYLSDHFQRMWTRFNFFVVIEVALIALIGRYFTADSGKLPWEIALTGGILSLAWYVFGAQDRWLVRVYRKQAEEAAKQAAKQAGISPYQFHTGSTSVDEAPDKGFREPDKGFRDIAEWRSESISITRLAALFPAFTILIWGFVFIVLVIVDPPY
jgi:hypothetical protein